MKEVKPAGLIPRNEVVTSKRLLQHSVFYSGYPIITDSLAGKLLSFMAETLTRESGEQHTLVPRKPEELLQAGGIVFVLDKAGQDLLETDSPEQIFPHIQGMAHLGLLHSDMANPDHVTDVEIRGVKGLPGTGAGREAIVAAAELARTRFPEAKLFIMVNDGSQIAMERLRKDGTLDYDEMPENRVPEAYYEDCANCPVRPAEGCRRRCCHTVLSIL